MGTIKGKECDIIMTTTGFKKNFENYNNVIFIENIVDKEEVTKKLKDFFEKNNL